MNPSTNTTAQADPPETTATKANDEENPFCTRYLVSDLKVRSVRGGAVTSLSYACRFVIRMGVTAVLARLLLPGDYGLIAMVTSITNLALMFHDLGLSTATVQKPDITHEQVSTLFWINVALGIVIAIIVSISAPAVAWFYNEPRLKLITVALAVPFVFGGLAVQHQALLRRHMKFVPAGLVIIAASALGGLAAIISWALGAGYWALVIMNIVVSASTAVGMWIAFPWCPGFPKKHIEIGGMLKFGGNVTGFSIASYFSRNIDKVLIGRFVGSFTLGLYSRAYQILMMPINQIRTPLNSVALPALSALQNDPERFRRYHAKLASFVAVTSMPLMVLMAICSNNVVALLLGGGWSGANRIFLAMAIAGIIQPVSGTRGVVMLASGQSGRYLRWGLFQSVTTVVSFVIGLNWGALGVAIAYACYNYLIFFPAAWYCFRQSPVSMKSFAQSLWRPLTASLCMGGVVFYIHMLLRHQMDVVQLGLCGVAGVCIFLVFCRLLPGGKAWFVEMRGYLALIVKR